ncbi:hypothetical protein DP44_5185 [Burkholderia pseudomallei]|nr:hypothetical protein DP44_5185 [Burkholderia pseudomallei]
MSERGSAGGSSPSKNRFIAENRGDLENDCVT